MDQLPLREWYGVCGPIARCSGAGLRLTTLALVLIGSVYAQSERDHSTLARLAPFSLLLDIASVEDRFVAVGERGHVLISSDQGASWTQVSVPTRATLTAVYFHDAKLGFAVGHDAVILRTEDGGQTWARVHYAPEEERPLFDVWFKNENDGVAIGAYGLYLETRDGGKAWKERVLKSNPLSADADSPTMEEDLGDDLHLNQIAASETGKLYMAAEAGNVYRSDDEGETWRRLPSPYEGSFFGVLPLSEDALLLFGLQGHLYRSSDAGETWRRIATGAEAVLMDGVRLEDGSIVIVGFAGTVLTSRDNGETFNIHRQEDRSGLATVAESQDGTLLVVGQSGVRKIEKHTLSLQDQRS